MGYENDMDDYYEEKWQKDMMMRRNKKSYYQLSVPSGTYSSDNIVILMWELFTHRLWHLWKHRRWMD